MRRAARIDATQNDIVDALRKIGAKVRSLAPIGRGFPDLIVGYRGKNVLLEVKSPGKVLSAGQQEFIAQWPGEVHVVCTPNEAINAVTGVSI